jgi:hypothetical protein
MSRATYRILVQRAVHTSVLADLLACSDKTTHFASASQSLLHIRKPEVISSIAILVLRAEVLEGDKRLPMTLWTGTLMQYDQDQ